MFKNFQCELKRFFHCELNTVNNESAMDRVEKYDITNTSIKNNFYGNEFVFRVKHTIDDEHFVCNCESFESIGIIYCHILKVIAHKKIKLFNVRYVLTRWRKDVIRNHLKKFFLGGYPHMTDEYKKYKELMTYFDEAYNIALDSEIMVQFVRSRLIDLLKDLSNFDHNMIQEVTQNGVTLSGNSGNDHIPNPTPNPVLNVPSPNFADPKMHRSRGRPKEIRYKP
ncbi:hypothetical protein RND71_014597 [Anisodus tanguticus]|uniref:Protein FAR1-RELATED SEQUENCE n=1 Tax=Anisodus tanguticus TaxID=243964 RepID=A0AAE1SBS6_9SOLA|nr:hypothetical protein RND71_014597 [Anisodus tanguticus]